MVLSKADHTTTTRKYFFPPGPDSSAHTSSIRWAAVSDLKAAAEVPSNAVGPLWQLVCMRSHHCLRCMDMYIWTVKPGSGLGLLSYKL